MTSLRCLFFLIYFSGTNAFIVQQMPSLAKVARKIRGMQLAWQISVGEHQDQRLPLQGLQNMFSARGESLVHQSPFFTGMKGREKVAFENGKRELKWPDERPRGYITFSFGVPKSVSE